MIEAVAIFSIMFAATKIAECFAPADPDDSTGYPSHVRKWQAKD